MINPFKTRMITIHGTYFGSHPKYPGTYKTLYMAASVKGIKLRKSVKTIDDIPWPQITGFDFTGDVASGVFYVELGTRSGTVKLEISSLHVGSAGDVQFRADQLRKKLNKFKRFVIDNKSLQTTA